MTKTTSCPICRGEIHSIAGRCKHCKADLVELRERAARLARAQAMGATVPPPPRALTPSTPPDPRAFAPQPAYSSATSATLISEPAPSGGDLDHGQTLVNPPGEAPGEAVPREYAPAYGPAFHVPPPPPHGTPPYGLGFAGARAHRASTWSRRWPFVVSAVALLAIGISIGVLAERWRKQGESQTQSGPRHSQVSRRPIAVPDRMPLPLMPSPRLMPDPAPDPSPPSPPSPPADPAPDPRAQNAPLRDPSNPGSRFSQPPSADPGTDASAFRTFTTSLTESLCQKLTQCGFIDSATQSMCRAFAKELDPDDEADKVARGECSFNQKAADACLRAVADLRCDLSSSDRVMDWLMAPNRVGECAEAFVCQSQ